MRACTCQFQVSAAAVLMARLAVRLMLRSEPFGSARPRAKSKLLHLVQPGCPGHSSGLAPRAMSPSLGIKIFALPPYTKLLLKRPFPIRTA